jgi:Holliday junction resolvasome RuvABC endonuclease subunit
LEVERRGDPEVRILALDPAAKTGWAFSSVIDRVEASGVWLITDEHDTHPGLRLRRLEEFILDQHGATPFDVIAYEKASFGSPNPAIKELHGELAGVIRLVAAKLFVPAWHFNPSQWKAIGLGAGGADKHGVIRALRTYFGIETTSEDQADAIGILLAAQKGPPPETEKQRTRRVEKEIAKRQGRLFGTRRR